MEAQNTVLTIPILEFYAFHNGSLEALVLISHLYDHLVSCLNVGTETINRISLLVT